MTNIWNPSLETLKDEGHTDDMPMIDEPEDNANSEQFKATMRIYKT